jgi:Fe-S-cluster-containing dehydrogenase component
VLTPGGQATATLSTQHFFDLEGDTAKLFPVVAPGQAMPPPKTLESLLPLPDKQLTADHQWAMVIDTSACIGCNACVVACQAENNIPVIGPDEIAHHRDMKWLRIDRYDRGDEPDPQPGFQPVPCMHCEEAPCEPVCPVEASIHDSQGLNVQVYNRCIGTRTCEANCPYKVRRFNFRDYTKPPVYGEEDLRSITAQRNPGVTVRARGVMEKCTYCVQRIEDARHDEDAFGTPIRDGGVVTACQSACPTQAIVFGDIHDPNSMVNHAKRDPRHYALLEELGTRPRTTYLAKVRS